MTGIMAAKLSILDYNQQWKYPYINKDMERVYFIIGIELGNVKVEYSSKSLIKSK